MKNTKGTGKSGKGMARGMEPLPLCGARTAKGKKSARFARTDSRYWLPRLFRSTYVEGGVKCFAKEYSARIQWQGRRHSFPLLSANAEAAATRATKIFKSLQRNGWEATLLEFSPTHGKPARPAALTVGGFLEAVGRVADTRPRTLADYMRSFRRIVAEVEGISETADAEGRKASRFDYRRGGRAAWVERVHAVKLAKITPARVQAWKIAYVNRAAGDPVAERRARISANSYLRQARGLFAKKILAHLSDLALPAPLPFEGVGFFKRESMRYVSRIDAGELVRAARDELAAREPEQWKIFLLAIGAGLRRKEIDSLLWRQVDFERGVIVIEATEYFRPKSAESAGEVEIDAELVAMLRGYRALATGPFVIESVGECLPAANYSRVRAAAHFEGLCQWLRGHGLDNLRPLHELRKEFGSLVNARAGLYAASRALRHADIAVTASHYLANKERVTVGLGAFLDVLPMRAKEGKRKGRRGA